MMAGDLMGLTAMGGAAGAGDAIGTIFEQRMKMARLAQEDALTRLRIQEVTDARAERLQARKDSEDQRASDAADRLQARQDIAGQRSEDQQDRLAANTFTMNPVGATIPTPLAQRAQRLGFPMTKIAGAPVRQTTGFMPMPTGGQGLQPPDETQPPASMPPPMAAGMSTTTADPSSSLSVPPSFQRGATQADVERGKADDLARRKMDEAERHNQEQESLRQHLADITDKVRSGQLNNQEAMLAIRERLASVAEQNAGTKAAKGLTLSVTGKANRAAIEQAGPLTDQALAMMEKEFPGIEKDPEQYNGLTDKGGSLWGALKYKAGFNDLNDQRRQIVNLLQPVQAGQYMRSSRSRQMLELTLKHMADMTQTPAAQHERLKALRSLMPEMLEGLIRAESPVDPSNPLAGSYFDPAKQGGGKTGSGIKSITEVK